MATLNKQAIAMTGLNPSYGAAAGGGDQFLNTGKEFLHVKNGGGAPVNVTIDSQTACNQGFDHNLVVAVTNGQERIIGPFDPGRFNDANGYVQIAYSGVGDVTVAVLGY
jgi:hypothetical protein